MPVKIRGTRFFVTLASDVDLPEDQRRAFEFLNPSVSTYDKMTDACPGSGVGTVATSKMVHKLLRGWSGVKTEDREIAAKYGVTMPPDAAADIVDLPYPANGVEIDLLDILALTDWRDLVKQAFATLQPVASGN